MKTSELMKKLNNMSGIRAFNKGRISVLDSTSECLAEVGLTCKQIFIYNNCPDEVSKLIVEYYSTPLEEREEEKKYVLKFPKELFGNCCLVKLDTNGSRYTYGLLGGLCSIETFTQKEIDAMPFDTNFFIKEEVL